MKRFFAIFTVGTMLAIPAVAHDFWLQPTRFILPAPATVPILIYVGHGAARDRWAQLPERVILFRSIGADGMIDRKPMLTLDGPRYDAEVPLARRGAYILAFQSNAASSDLPFLRFNDYVVDEGLTPIAAHRQRTGTERTNGREQYSRRAKAIIQVGPVDTASVARVTRPVGLSLEIVPERHPLALKSGEPLPVRVYFNRQPLAGALIKLTDLDADAKPVKIMRTDRAGRAMFALPKKGQWQFNVIWSVVTPKNPAADYRTTFSSLTFGN